MSAGRALWGVASCLLVMLICCPDIGRAAGEEQRAERLNTRGKRYFGAGRYEEALEAFRAAWAEHRDPRYLYNEGRSLESLERYEEAVTVYSAHLDAAPDAETAVEVETKIRVLDEKVVAKRFLSITSVPPGAEVYAEGTQEPLGRTPLRTWMAHGPARLKAVLAGYLHRTTELEIGDETPAEITIELVSENAPGRLTVMGAPQAARIFVDAQDVGLAPLGAPLTLAPGDHALRVCKAGWLARDEQITVAPDSVQTLEITLDLVPPAPTEVPLGTWVLAGTALAAAGVAATFYGLAGAAHSDASDIYGVPDKKDEYLSLRDDYRSRLVVGHIGAGVAGAAVVGAVVWLLVENLDDEAASREDSCDTAPAGVVGGRAGLRF